MNKITIIHPRAGVDWKDNSAMFAIELARRLDNHFEVKLLSGADCGSFSRPLNSIIRSELNRFREGVLTKSFFSRCWNQPQVTLEHLTNFMSCLAYLWHHPADLILSHYGYSSLLAATLIREIHGTPILHTQHSTENLRRNLALRPERLICLNPLAADQARRLAPQQSISTIPYGVDLGEFCPQGKAIATGLAQPCIIAVASLNRDRPQRLELTIEAVSRIPNASLLICGEGADQQYFQDLGDRLLGRERFQIKSFAYAQMPQVYRSANIFTCAATEEKSGGMKYIEAMACGLPVVATDDAVRRYLIGSNGGMTCDVTDIECYAKSLQTTWSEYHYWQQPRQNALRFSLQGVSLMYYKAIIQTITDSDSKFTPLPSHQIE